MTAQRLLLFAFVRNDPYMADLATRYLASGAAVLVAGQYALHSLNHLTDVGEADPGRLGPANLIALVLLGWMLREAAT